MNTALFDLDPQASGSSWSDKRNKPAPAAVSAQSARLPGLDTDREFSASFDRQASATRSVSFLGLFLPKANRTFSFFVSFDRGATWP